MRRRSRAAAHLANDDPDFYTCPHYKSRELTIPDRGSHDLQGRRLYKCSRYDRITSDKLLMSASRAKRLLD